MASCVKHPMAVSEHVCGRCGHEFCAECVVFPFGLKKPPLCISCALEAGGVRRQHTGRPRLSAGQVRDRLAEQRARAAVQQPIPAIPPPEQDTDEPWLDGSERAEDVGGWSKKF
jgi:hypothetical protein